MSRTMLSVLQLYAVLVLLSQLVKPLKRLHISVMQFDSWCLGNLDVCEGVEFDSVEMVIICVCPWERTGND